MLDALRKYIHIDLNEFLYLYTFQISLLLSDS